MLIDRYIAKLFIGFFLGGLIAFVSLFVAVDFMTNLIRYDVATDSLLRYYSYYIPGIVYQMTPVACLIGAVFTLSNLNKHNELVALFSAGMSLARVAAPILFWVVIVSGLTFWMSDRLLPTLTQKKNYVYYVEIKKQPGLYSTVRTNKIWYRSNNILFNIKTLQPETGHIQGLTLYYFNSAWELIQMITAQDVALKGKVWELNKGTVTLFTSESNVPMTKDYQTKVITMNEDAADLQASSQATADMLSLNGLKKFITRNKEAGLDTLRYEVDYQAKYSFAFAAFVMSFLGIPFSVSRARSGSTTLNVGLCVGLAFLYWSAYSSGITLGRHGILPPMVAVWVPNLSVLFLSTILLLRLKR